VPGEVARNTERPKLVRSGVWGVLRVVGGQGFGLTTREVCEWLDGG